MNWDALGAVGEIVGAVAVVISVIYLAIQIKRQTDQQRLSASRELVENWNDWLNHIVEDEEFAELWLKGAANYSALPNTERIRMLAFLFTLMRTLEQQYLHVRKGHLDPEYFESAQLTLFEVLRLPGVQEFWSQNKESFGKGYRAYVEEQIAAARDEGYESTFKEERENPPNKSLESDA